MAESADEHKAWLAGVFDRAAATYDRVGHPSPDQLVDQGRRVRRL